MSSQKELSSPLEPALRALEGIRSELTKRVGKPGGNLNEKVRAQLDTVESTLLQIVPIGTTMKLINQQTELAVHAFRNLERIQPALTEGDNGDDGTSDVKGQ